MYFRGILPLNHFYMILMNSVYPCSLSLSTCSPLHHSKSQGEVNIYKAIKLGQDITE